MKDAINAKQFILQTRETGNDAIYAMFAEKLQNLTVQAIKQGGKPSDELLDHDLLSSLQRDILDAIEELLTRS